MKTQAVIGCPEEIVEKRIARIKEALDIQFSDENKPVKYIIDKLPDGIEVYFEKPGKEYFRIKPNKNDMSPNVGDLFPKFSFSDIWCLLCKLQNAISKENYIKFSVILYRVAYLLDFDYVNGKVRFSPCEELMNEIKQIQDEVDRKKLDFNVLAFIHFMDILGWNDEMKTHADNNGVNYDKTNHKKGRINTILSCMVVPFIFQSFVDNVLANAGTPEHIDFSLLTKITQNFSRSRGIYSATKRELIELLAPELYE